MDICYMLFNFKLIDNYIIKNINDIFKVIAFKNGSIYINKVEKLHIKNINKLIYDVHNAKELIYYVKNKKSLF